MRISDWSSDVCSSDLRVLAKVEALGRFLMEEDGGNLLVAYRRANNIVRAEMKKTPELTLGEVDGKLITVEEERLLVAALAEFGRAATGKTQDEADFRHYLATLARLRQPVDAFFERVKIGRAHV